MRAAVTGPAAGTQQAAQAGRVDEEDVAEVDDEWAEVHGFQQCGIEDRPAGDIDVAVNDDHPTGVAIDGERVVIFHLSHAGPPVAGAPSAWVSEPEATAPVGVTSILVTRGCKFF